MSALHCRAVLLLQKELFKTKQQKIWGIDVLTDEKDCLYWKVVISGLKGTPTEGAEFNLHLKFDETFNNTPPEVFFVDVIPFHPNVSLSNGQVCLGCLEQWNENTPVVSILLSIQQLLSEPFLGKKAWNQDAVQIMRETPKRYKQLVLDTVLDCKRADNSLSTLRITSTTPTVTQRQETPIVATSQPPSITTNDCHKRHTGCEKLSYENYLEGWKNLGTTRSDRSNEGESVVTLLSEKYEFGKDSVKESISEEICQQLSDHQRLMYGSFTTPLMEEKSQKRAERLKSNKVQLLKDFHSNKKGVQPNKILKPSSPPHHPVIDETISLEAKELLEWSRNLSEKNI